MTDNNCSGSCLCQAVGYEIRPPYAFFQYCHCNRCQKNSGSAHAANILVAEGQFAWTRGEDLVRRYELPEAKYYCTAFCTVCGSALPWRTRNGVFFLVPAGTLDGDPGAPLERNIYWDSRSCWYERVDDLPLYAKGPK